MWTEFLSSPGIWFISLYQMFTHIDNKLLKKNTENLTSGIITNKKNIVKQTKKMNKRLLFTAQITENCKLCVSVKV